MRVRMLHYLRIGSRITIMQSHTHTKQQTHMHKTVTGRIEAKKLLSRQRQSEYALSAVPHSLPGWIQEFSIESRGAGKARFNVATPTYATVTCTAYVLPYNFQTKSI